MPSNPELLIEGPKYPSGTIALGHGAGAGMNTPFMDYFAKELAGRGFRVVRFEFSYMATRRHGAKARPPDREPVLRQTWLDVVKMLGRDRLVIGGKSMGGRIASLVADEAKVASLVCLGYPFHPVGKPDRLQVSHLEMIQTPTLIVQGTRDPFGHRDQVVTYSLAPSIRVHWLPDGDHDYKPRKGSGTTQQQNWTEAVKEIALFVNSLA